MSIFKRDKNQSGPRNDAILSGLALKYIHDGVIIADKNNVVCFINPAAVIMTGCSSAENAIGLDYGLIIKIESKQGRTFSDNENPLIQAMMTNQPLDSYQASLIDSSSDKRIPVSINVIPAGDASNNRIITLRNITKELAEEGEQTEFISTASHEMRTPVATIDGYLSLALNPQTATIDERARGYLDAAEKASKHLGKLFQDLLDVTKLDDGKIKPNFEPIEVTEFVKSVVADYEMRAKDAKLNLSFGSSGESSLAGGLKMQPVVYGFVDTSFMREILDNLLENAIKYTPEGGSVYVNVRGDGDRFLINVTDTGIGISADDLNHVFQKFYRADNSDTRTIGGTGLGLYLVKQRTEAMGGKVWAESAFGEGSTFYVSLPRLTDSEYEKRMIMVQNLAMQKQAMASATTPAAGQTAFQIAGAPNQSVPTPAPAPVSSPPVAPAVQAPVNPVPSNPAPIQTSPAPPTNPPIPSSPPIPPTNPSLVTNNIPTQTNNNLNGESKWVK